MKRFLKNYAKYIVWGSLLVGGAVFFFTAIIKEEVNIGTLLVFIFLQALLPALVETLRK